MRPTTAIPGIEKYSALVVEDNAHMRALIRRMLGNFGIRDVHECKEGAEGLQYLSSAKPDLILCDLSMAPMDGLTFTKAVRRLPNEAQSMLPIIMVTGHTERWRVEAARDAGVNELLVKPITTAGLLHRIGEIVQRRRPFVWGENYIGPCRRRHAKPGYAGPWRRKTDNEEGRETVAVDAPQDSAAAGSPAR